MRDGARWTLNPKRLSVHRHSRDTYQQHQEPRGESSACHASRSPPPPADGVFLHHSFRFAVIIEIPANHPRSVLESYPALLRNIFASAQMPQIYLARRSSNSRRPVLECPGTRNEYVYTGLPRSLFRSKLG